MDRLYKDDHIFDHKDLGVVRISRAGESGSVRGAHMKGEEVRFADVKDTGRPLCAYVEQITGILTL